MDNNEIKNALEEKLTRIEYDDIINSQTFLKKYGYKLKRILGVGRFGAVMEARNMDSN